MQSFTTACACYDIALWNFAERSPANGYWIAEFSGTGEVSCSLSGRGGNLLGFDY